MKPKKAAANNMAPRTRETAVPMKEALPQHEESDPLRHLTIQVPESLRRELKTRASQQGTTVREIVVTAIQQELNKQ